MSEQFCGSPHGRSARGRRRPNPHHGGVLTTMRDWNRQARNREARLARAAHLAQRQAGAAPRTRVRCWKRCSSRATGSAWRATTRSRPISWPRRWPRSTRRGCTTCTWCSRCWRCRSISTSSSAASPRSWTSPSPGRRRARLAKLAGAGRIEIGAIHTYLELFARYFVDLTPHVALVAAQAADRRRQPLHRPQHRGHAGDRRGDRLQARHRHRPGQRARRRAAARRHPGRLGRLRDRQRRRPHYIEPLFTRDPAQITEIQVLMAMMAIKGIYAEYGCNRLNHGIGFDTAAIELLLPTYARIARASRARSAGTGRSTRIRR